MSEKKQESKEQRQYGVRYPDGRTFWVAGDTGAGQQLPGGYGITSLGTAQDRGKLTDSWRAQIAGLGVDPETVKPLTFVSRTVTTNFGDATSVADA